MRVSVVIDTLDPEQLAPFWQEALGYRRVGEVPGFVVLAPPPDAVGPGLPVLILQRVGEPRSGKNRLHLDLHCDDVPAAADRLTALGGRRLGGPVTELLGDLGVWWQVMVDPQGNEFCLVADPGHPAPSSG